MRPRSNDVQSGVDRYCRRPAVQRIGSVTVLTEVGVLNGMYGPRFCGLFLQWQQRWEMCQHEPSSRCIPTLSVMYAHGQLLPLSLCRAVTVNLKRGMAGGEGTPKYGAAKSFQEAWLSDKG
ncbi:unnamed protein product, partial [Ectocarpus fasciculatus]